MFLKLDWELNQKTYWFTIKKVKLVIQIELDFLLHIHTIFNCVLPFVVFDTILNCVLSFVELMDEIHNDCVIV